MTTPEDRKFVSRAGRKLAHALAAFNVSPANLVCADLGSNAGGFVDCLLQAGATRVYAVERGYGVLDFKLRQNRCVVVMERTDALHVRLPEPVQIVSIDAGWTRQRLILPAALRLLSPGGQIISLVKPHYEAKPEQLMGGVLIADQMDAVLDEVRQDVTETGLQITGEVESPIQGHGGNREFLFRLSMP